MLKFKLFGGETIEDIGEYLLEYYKKYPEIVIYVGTDSAQHGKVTKYATVISLLRPTKGAHIVYTKVIIKRERDLFSRLWNEVEYTREVAELVQKTFEDVYPKENMIPILHLDFNAQPKYKSHMVHDLAIGYLTGLGYEVHGKSEGAWAASVAADSLVHN